MDCDRIAIRQFVERVHGRKASGWLVLWTRHDKTTKAFNLGEPRAIDGILDYIAACAVVGDVYAAVGRQGRPPANGCRGKEIGVVSVPGLWADVNVAGPAHKSFELP